MDKVAVVGAGIGGLAAAIRLARAGADVTVFEANSSAGGKINNLQLGEFRFDMGPSVFTAPQYIQELYELCDEDFSAFSYKKLDVPFHYFFEDGTKMKMYSDREKLLKEFETVLGEKPKKLDKYLTKAEKNYNYITPLFIETSLQTVNEWMNIKLVKALTRLPHYKLNATMDEENKKTFSNPKTQQIFNRFATYNGSDPYKAPAMLNMIAHLELTDGVFFPKNGMVQITQELYKLALKQGVVFHFNEKVDEIYTIDEKVKGLRTKKNIYDFDAVFSNMDVGFTYEKLLPASPKPEKILTQEKSSSAMVFYWGVNAQFEELAVHNMFFSDDYPAEFQSIFDSKTLPEAPSIYVHITSKEKPEDAPQSKENWFVMINVPINTGQDWEEYREKARSYILKKLSKSLQVDLTKKIEEEFVMDPVYIERTYFGKAGSIYGNASNNKFAAFYRHPNASKTIKGLYFVGVTVHPGGGIPLALNSAKIAVETWNKLRS